jgi:hypothetical protein
LRHLEFEHFDYLELQDFQFVQLDQLPKVWCHPIVPLDFDLPLPYLALFDHYDFVVLLLVHSMVHWRFLAHYFHLDFHFGLLSIFRQFGQVVVNLD